MNASLRGAPGQALVLRSSRSERPSRRACGAPHTKVPVAGRRLEVSRALGRRRRWPTQDEGRSRGRPASVLRDAPAALLRTRATAFTQVEFAMLFMGLLAVAGFPFSAKRGRWPKAGWGAESRYSPTKVRGDGPAIRVGVRQRATPHPALRAPFPSKLGKGSPRDLRCMNTLGTRDGGVGRRLEPRAGGR
jgi:hypothetical protein